MAPEAPADAKDLAATVLKGMEALRRNGVPTFYIWMFDQPWEVPPSLLPTSLPPSLSPSHSHTHTHILLPPLPHSCTHAPSTLPFFALPRPPSFLSHARTN
jgi:hypothetical protein